MRLATVRTPSGSRAAIVDGEVLELLDHVDVGALLASGASPEPTGHRVPLERSALAPVVASPGKIICVGMNYAAHIAEMGHEPPEFPTLFAKYADALIGAHDDIDLPPETRMLDWEVELALVIGSTVRRASVDAARDAIAGYTIMNDITARDWQRRTPQWLQGKTFEHTTPLGPVLVTTDELGDVSDLEVRCDVDGQTRQHARTSDLVFAPIELVRYISTVMTLRPGDVIATGTPAGVGAGADPQAFLGDGSIVRTTIEGIGTMENRCVAVDL